MGQSSLIKTTPRLSFELLASLHLGVHSALRLWIYYEADFWVNLTALRETRTLRVRFAPGVDSQLKTLIRACMDIIMYSHPVFPSRVIPWFLCQHPENQYH